MKVFKLSLLAATLIGLSACSLEGDDGQNGTNGTDGSDGLNSLIAQTVLAVGNSNCPNGGVQIDSGLDSDADGSLSATEVTATEYVCTPGVTSVSSTELTASLNNEWFQAGEAEVAEAKTVWTNATATTSAKSAAAAKTLSSLKGSAKNIILFVGDGMGISTVTAARILEGQQAGETGEEHQLSFEKFPFAGLSKTYNVNAQTPDSAGTMTAMMTGVKSDAGVISVGEDANRSDCASMSGNELITALELAEIAGKSTGIVTTARITHATPAATYANSPERNWEDDGDMSADDIAAGCEDIAAQLIHFESNLEARVDGADVDGIEVAMGGGRRSFLPKDAAYNSADAVSSVEGDRTDGTDLITEWQDTYSDGTYVYDQAGFDAIDASTTTRVLGLFNESHMQYDADRDNDVAGEPTLAEMTEKAIDILDNNSEGFFLMVEAGRIDHGHHAGSAYNALTDTIALSDAVAKAAEMTSEDDTLIIVTADHGHVFTIAGYPKRGNPILGKVVGVGATEPSLAADGMPYTTVGYTNGPGFHDLGDSVTDADAVYYAAAPDSRRNDLSDIDTTSSGYHQESLVPFAGSETHSGEDVGIFARGPGALLVQGTNEQNMIFHIMNYVGNLKEQAEAKLAL